MSAERQKVTLAFCEMSYMDGMADEVSGNVEAPTGHFYRIGRYMVTTDSQGFTSLEIFDSEALAKLEFQRRDEDFSEWDTDED